MGKGEGSEGRGERNRGEKEKRKRREKNLFGFSKPEFIPFSVFQKEVSFLCILNLDFDF